MENLKEIKGIFKLPKKSHYFGKAIHGTPYMFPINYCGSIIKIRKLKLRTKEEYDEYMKKYPYSNSKYKRFSNLPMVKRTKYYIKKIFGSYYFIELGYPIMIANINLGWKDKFGSPRYEWCPQKHIYFFGLQYSIFYNAPDIDNDNDTYYEMILHYLYYADKDIIKAKKTWKWKNYKTKESTWDKKYVINLRKEKLKKLQKLKTNHTKN